MPERPSLRLDDAGPGSRTPWPRNATFTPRGLEIAGVSAEELAARHGTPLLIVDEDDLRARCRQVREVFSRVHYAVKAFTAQALLRVVAEEGLDLLVSSEGELEACTRAGIRGDRIWFHGNNKSDRELALAAERRVGAVIVDNVDEIERLTREATVQGIELPVLLRVLPEVEARTHPAIETGAKGSKFGIPLSDALEAVRAVRAATSLRFEGLHAHIGSQVLAAEPYLRTVDTLIDLLRDLRRDLGVTARILDIGGGFGVTYADETPLGLAELASTVLARVRAGAAERGLDAPQVVVEPGRSLVANTTITLYRTGARKHVAGSPTLLAIDGGMADNIRPMLYGARFTIAAAGPLMSEQTERVTLVGRHCESGDVLADDVTVPAHLAPGSLIAVASTGAYTYSMASTYNRVGRPAVVSVVGGRSRMWVRREDPADLDRLEVPPAGAIPQVQPPEGIAIRAARPQDAASFLRMWKAVVAEGVHVRTEQVRGTVRSYRRRFREPWSDREAWVVAVEGGRVVGNLHIQREEHPVTRHVATLGLAVDAAFRSRGIGAALLAEALRWAQRVGVEKVELSVFPTNAAAIALYRRFGFVDEGRLVKRSRKSYGYEDEILMARWIERD
ncbi:MAG: diaminopimelate decarboxylase [Actinomycetota bacterium]